MKQHYEPFSATVERVAREMHAAVEPFDAVEYPGWEDSPEDEKNFYRSCAVRGLRLERRILLSTSRNEIAQFEQEWRDEAAGEEEMQHLDARNALMLREAIDLLGTEAGSAVDCRALAYLED